MEYRKGLDMWEESKDVRCSHLLFEDLKKERTDINKMTFYIWLQENYKHLKGKSKEGNLGYKIKWKPLNE